MISRHLVIHGRVQGVFFRKWTIDNATELGLSGWVRNLPDGTVEAHFEGEEQVVLRMVEAAHDGPPRAQVERIGVTQAQHQGLKGFERR